MTHPLVKQSNIDSERVAAEDAEKDTDQPRPMCVRCGKRERESRYEIQLCEMCVKELFGSDGG